MQKLAVFGSKTCTKSSRFNSCMALIKLIHHASMCKVFKIKVALGLQYRAHFVVS